MATVAARRFGEAFTSAFSSAGRTDRSGVAELRRAAAAIADPVERAAAERLVGLVRHDRELDAIEVTPARRALATLLGTSPRRLPADLEAVLTHAVPAANVRVQHYDLNFDFSRDGASFPAQCRITLDSPCRNEAILEVDPTRLTIEHVTVGGEVVPFEVRDGRLHVRASQIADLTIAYRVRPTEAANGYGLIRDKYSNSLWTLTWPYHTGALFPSNSAPDDGATARVTVKVAGERSVVAAGLPGRDGSFAIGKPIPAYAVAFFVGEFDRAVSATGEHGVTVAAHGAPETTSRVVRRRYAEAAADATDFFTEWLGRYEFGDHINIVEIPGAFGGGMENVGAIGLSRDATENPSYAAEVAVHETAHHWFGDNVRIAHWGEFWMSEGFTEYATYRFYRERHGQRRFCALLDRAKGELRAALGKQPRMAADAATDVHEIFTAVPYELGAWLLRMVETRLGTPKFDQVMRGWYRERRLTAASTDEFVAFVRRETGHDLSAFVAAWDRLDHLPTLTASTAIKGRDVTVTLGQDAALPADTVVPLALYGRGGKCQIVLVQPGEERTVSAPFPVTRLAWDPERTLLADIIAG